MTPMGRPATGHKPVVSIRMAPEVLRRAKNHARGRRRVLGAWLEEAVAEKIQREGDDGDR